MSNRCDLALEARELFTGGKDTGDIPGTSVIVDNGNPDIIVTHVKVLDGRGEQVIGKPIGDYITIEVPKLIERDPMLEDQVSGVIGQAIRPLLPKMDKNSVTLVVGLGNAAITPDSLGPVVVDNMMVTRHLFSVMPEQIDKRVHSVCVLSPGVLGTTGIETNEIIFSVVDKIKPSLVIVIDALASRKTSRINTTIQISNTGISPGSGVGNQRNIINSNTLGVPVIAIGVPTVVYATTITRDAIAMLNQHGDIHLNMDEDQLDQLIRRVVTEDMGDLVVTPKEIDLAVTDVAGVISRGLNLMLHEGVTLDEINRFLH